MTQPDPGHEIAPGQWGWVILAWLLVGTPLLWGVWTTLQKAAALFH